MKPNDKAYKEFMRVYNKTHVSLEAQIMASLTAAYAAQFQSEDYAGLVERLRHSAILGRRFVMEPNRWVAQYEKAADAIEALLAEREALKGVVEIYEKKLSGIEDEIRLAVQSAIAAIRPHIEAAERERCAKRILETIWVDADPEEIAAAIRSGK